MCEIQQQGCSGRAQEASHRVNRKMGGRHGAARGVSDRLSDLVHSCRHCHRWVGDNPRAARLRGLQVVEGVDPATIPLILRGDLVYLDDFGGVHHYEQVGA